MSKNVDYTKKVLEVSHLKEHFKNGVGKNKLVVKAVDDISFDIYKKEVFGLVGESGCGKTTTGRTILRLHKPTSGNVKLNGNVICSGCDDTIELIKKTKREYLLNRLALNKYKYDRYLIKQKYSKLKLDLEEKIKKLNNTYSNQEQELKSDISKYEKDLFEQKSKFKVDNDMILFSFKVDKEAVINKTMNEHLIEYNQILKGVKASFKQKMDGIKESAGLSDESKASHRVTLEKLQKEKLEAIKATFMPKIESRSTSLLSKEDAKKQIVILKAAYLQEKAKLLKNYNEYVSSLKKPDTVKIKEEVRILKAKLKTDIALIKTEVSKLSKQKATELAAVTSSKSVNQEELQKLTDDYKEFREEHKAIIKESRQQQNSPEAIENVKEMQMIFQDPISSLNPRMIVQEIVSEGLVINGEKDKELMVKKVKEALELVGLAPEYISRYPHEFSGGQRQRIGIARALIMNPSIIVADEPISALDVSIKAQVINLLSELREQLDLTILFIAHDLSVVKFFCDRIAVMYYGKIVELASSEELFAHPLHNYTKSLLSAIPHPDPDSEKKRVRISYSPYDHDYSTDLPEFIEITKGHFVRANKNEIIQMKKELGVTDEN